MSRFRFLLCCAVLVGWAGGVVASPAEKEPDPTTPSTPGTKPVIKDLLANSTWRITLNPTKASGKLGEKTYSDSLSFAEKQLSSSMSGQLSFTSAPYTITQDGATWQYKAISKSETNGNRRWVVEVNGDNLSGKMTWTKVDGTVLKYKFTGMRVHEP